MVIERGRELPTAKKEYSPQKPFPKKHMKPTVKKGHRSMKIMVMST